MVFGLQDEDIDKINRVFAGFPEIRKVKIYGSRAKGNYRKGSDIDLTIMDVRDFNLTLKVGSELEELLLPYKIDLSLYQLISDADVLSHIDRVGQVFFNRSQSSSNSG